MKKIVSIILAALMLCALCAPAFAEDEPTEIKPEERGDSKVISINDAGNYIIKGDYSVNNIYVGSFFKTDVTLTIPKGVTVTVTTDFSNFGTINVCGTLIISDSASSKINTGTINIMSCSGGKLEGTINGPGTVNTCDEHSFENGKCTYCGYECENAFHKGVYKCPDCDMEYNASSDEGSTISDGNVLIVIAIAAAVIFGFSGYFLGKKKRVA